MESDRVIKYIGLSTHTFIDMEAIKKEVGVCLDTFYGVNNDNITCVLAGLSFPYSALEKIKTKIDESRDAINKSLSATREKKLVDGINFLAEQERELERGQDGYNGHGGHGGHDEQSEYGEQSETTDGTNKAKPKLTKEDIFSKYLRK